MMRIKILYEDSDVLATDKPSGIAVHSDGRSKEQTITDWILKKYPGMKNVGESLRLQIDNQEWIINRPGVVHRLDKETSGVLLLAKNQKAYTFLKNQFQNREVKKVYHAVVSGSVKKDLDIINRPIGRSSRDFRKRLSGRGVRGKTREAITQYKVLKRFTDEQGNDFSYLEIHPKTGRTHQIRVHMKFINHPIVCDSLYAPDAPCPKNFNRLALHAESIEFHNLAGKAIKVESPLPKEFSNILTQ